MPDPRPEKIMTFPKFSRRLNLAVMTVFLMVGSALTLTVPFRADAGDAPAKPAKDEQAGAKEKASSDGKEEKKSKLEHTDGYVHEWLSFPGFEAIALPDGGKFSFKPVRGEMAIIVMTASWCTPCVKLMPEILRLQARTARLPVRFVHIFTHDTKQDATAFMVEYKMPKAVLATHEVLATFKNPELPAIFVADRNKFMLTRYLKADNKNLRELEDSIKYLTAL